MYIYASPFLVKKCLFWMRKQMMYIFHGCLQIAMFLKTGNIYIYIYITYRNFHTFTQADYPQFLQWWEKNFNRLPTLVDNPHPKTKENLKLKQSFDIISFSVQLIIFHTFCLRFFIENDTTCKICSRKKSDISRSTESEKSLYWNG